jgi:chromosome segregation ATPase
MNKWKRRGREWRERNESLWDFWHQTSDRLVEALNNVEELRRQIELLKKRDTTALRREKENHQWGCDLVEEKNVLREKVDELRRDNVKLATGLARVQGVCEATQAQVLKHSATIVNLRERENEALKESEGLLAWQRRAGEATNTLAEFQCEGAPVAFFSEAYLYPLVGKEDARTLLHRVRMLREAIEAEAEPKEET